MRSEKEISKRNFYAKALRLHPQQVVRPKVGRGAYSRRPKYEEALDDG